MTSREKRFQEKKAEEVKLALTGHVKCPQCKKFKKEELEESFWDTSKRVGCLACRNKIEVEFISDIAKKMGRPQETEITARTRMIFGDVNK